jgi:hypothetical protein
VLRDTFSTCFYRTAFLLHGYHALLIFVAPCASRALCRFSLLILSFLPLYFLLRPLPLRSPTTREDTQYTSESIKAYTSEMEHLLLTRPVVIHHLLNSPEVRQCRPYQIQAKSQSSPADLQYSIAQQVYAMPFSPIALVDALICTRLESLQVTQQSNRFIYFLYWALVPRITAL